jgi:hypothetical protein
MELELIRAASLGSTVEPLSEFCSPRAGDREPIYDRGAVADPSVAKRAEGEPATAEAADLR